MIVRSRGGAIHPVHVSLCSAVSTTTTMTTTTTTSPPRLIPLEIVASSIATSLTRDDDDATTVSVPAGTVSIVDVFRVFEDNVPRMNHARHHTQQEEEDIQEERTAAEAPFDGDGERGQDDGHEYEEDVAGAHF